MSIAAADQRHHSVPPAAANIAIARELAAGFVLATRCDIIYESRLRCDADIADARWPRLQQLLIQVVRRPDPDKHRLMTGDLSLGGASHDGDASRERRHLPPAKARTSSVIHAFSLASSLSYSVCRSLINFSASDITSPNQVNMRSGFPDPRECRWTTHDPETVSLEMSSLDGGAEIARPDNAAPD